MKYIAVIGGTRYDTALGCELLSQLHYWCEGFSIASTVEEQNQLQYLDKPAILKRLEAIINSLDNKIFDTILFFCNSLVMAIDDNSFSQSTHMKIISPKNIYKEIARQYNRIFVFAANGQALSGIEQILLQHNNCIEINGFCSIPCVKVLESNLSPEEIYRIIHFDKVLKIADELSVECIILGCTHLVRISKVLKKNTHIPIIDIGSELVLRINRSTTDLSDSKNKK